MKEHLGECRGGGPRDHLVASEAAAFRTQLRELLPADDEEGPRELVLQLHLIAIHRQLLTVFSAPLVSSSSSEAQAATSRMSCSPVHRMCTACASHVHRMCIACASHVHRRCAAYARPTMHQAARLSDELLAAILRSYRMSRHERQPWRSSVDQPVSHVAETLLASKTCSRLRAEALLSTASGSGSGAKRLSSERKERRLSCHGKDWETDAILGGGLLQLVVRWGRADLVKQAMSSLDSSCTKHTHRTHTYARCTHTQHTITCTPHQHTTTCTSLARRTHTACTSHAPRTPPHARHRS